MAGFHRLICHPIAVRQMRMCKKKGRSPRQGLIASAILRGAVSRKCGVNVKPKNFQYSAHLNEHRTSGGMINSLQMRRLGIDTYQELVVYMRSDCHICKSEGFEAKSQVEVWRGNKHIIATLNARTYVESQGNLISLQET
jgi:hypothetical protein